MHLRSAPADSPDCSRDEISTFCPRFQYTIELLGRRWAGAIIRALIARPCRFNELLTRVPGLSDRLLTERLRELERAGLVQREVRAERPVRITYGLTASGHSLLEVIRVVSDWAERWVDA